MLAANGNEIMYRLTDSEMLQPVFGDAVLQLSDGNERLTIARIKVIISDNIEIGEATTEEEVQLIHRIIENMNKR